MVAVAQLVRALGCGPGCWGFESPQPPLIKFSEDEMSILESITLGMLQGITEFLPVSSSAHLVFTQTFFGLKQNMLFFDILLHFATLLAVLVVFSNSIVEYLKSWRVVIYIILATIPTGIIGVVVKKNFSFVFESPKIAALCLIITGLLLYFSESKYLKNKEEKIEIQNISWLKSLIIGLFQGIAVLPGISRSGATLSSSLILNIKKEEAVKFIFIMSIPAILGATLLEVKDFVNASGEIGSGFEFVYIYGLISAFVCGILSLKFLVNLVQKNRLKYFAYYCGVLGLAVLVLAFIYKF